MLNARLSELGGGMFDDNKNQSQQSTGQDSAPAPPTVSNVTAASNNVTPPPTVVVPTAPPLSSATIPEQPTQPFAENRVTPPPNAMNAVHLESTYIPTNPPQVKGDESTPADKPTAASMVASADEGQLLKLKQQALQNLAPMVDDLDQPPEEKFKTLMMLIQASDNPQYIQDAFNEANKITDEKARAQALLDVVNEINYFTQHSPETLESKSG